MECPYCGKQDCTEIEINLQAEDRVKFYSCRNCESKWWERDGDLVALNDVLAATGKRAAR